MNRKVFISVLGTGLYGKCKYVDDRCGFVSSWTRFVQQASLEYYKVAEWSEDDTCIFLLTDKARKNNWNRDIRDRYKGPDGVIPYRGLQSVIDDLNPSCRIKDISIPEGRDESEMWSIFNILFNLLEENDELYFDLTHSFRYLPMLVLVLGNYAKFLKNTSIKAVSYGNYEAKVADRAPIVDLLPLTALQDWTFAAGQFLSSGDVKELVDLSKKSLDPIIRNVDTREAGKKMKGFISALDSSIDERRFCRGINIIESISFSRMKCLADVLDTAIIEPFNPIFIKIKESMSDFDTNENIRNGFEAVRWCINYGLYQQAATMLQENTVTAFCMKYGYDWRTKSGRNPVYTAFNVANRPEDEWCLDISNKLSPEEYEKCKEEIRQLHSDEAFKSVCECYKNLTQLRNDFNHSGFRQNCQSVTSMKANIVKYNDTIRGVLIDTGAEAPSSSSLPGILLNVSNHPSSDWTEDQLSSAVSVYGGVIDIQFPQIPPECTEGHIDELADQYMSRISEFVSQYRVTVHIMGEMNFCYTLIRRLKSRGIECVASTTERIVDEHPDGTKTSRFKFVRFRRYA